MYRINVYANKDGELIKLGDYTVIVKPADISNPFSIGKITLLIIVALGATGGVILGIESHRKKKNTPHPERGAFDIYQH